MPSYDDVADRLNELPEPFTWQDVHRLVADGDDDRFVDLWLDRLPQRVRARCLTAESAPIITTMLLRKLVRLQVEAMGQYKVHTAALHAILELRTGDFS